MRLQVADFLIGDALFFFSFFFTLLFASSVQSSNRPYGGVMRRQRMGLRNLPTAKAVYSSHASRSPPPPFLLSLFQVAGWCSSRTKREEKYATIHIRRRAAGHFPFSPLFFLFFLPLFGPKMRKKSLVKVTRT